MKAPGHERVGRVGDLEIREDMRFQESSWRWQRVGQVVVLLFVLGGLAGVFGTGPWSETQVRDRDGTLQVAYPRVGRAQASLEIVVDVAPALVRPEGVTVWIEAAWLERYELEQVVPEAREMVAGPGRVEFHFAVAGAETTARLRFQLRPREAGPLRGAIGVPGGPSVQFTQFIHP